MLRTICRPVRHHGDTIKGSRFVGSAAPVQGEEEARAFIARVRDEMQDANHHCWAFRARGGSLARCSDDGEPSGSAGRPILAQLEGRNLSKLVIVVTRFFGGTKLGIGGLVRAYGNTAAKLLDEAELIELVTTVQRRILVDYQDLGAVQRTAASGAFAILETDFGTRVSMKLEMREEELQNVAQLLRDASAGRVVLTDPQESGKL